MCGHGQDKFIKDQEISTECSCKFTLISWSTKDKIVTLKKKKKFYEKVTPA